jgi:hypothetical protein
MPPPARGEIADAGMALLCVGLVCLARLGERTGLWDVIWPQLIAALGQSLFQSPNNSTIMGAAPGVAAGMLATGRTMGTSLPPGGERRRRAVTARGSRSWRGCRRRTAWCPSRRTGTAGPT